MSIKLSRIALLCVSSITLSLGQEKPAAAPEQKQEAPAKTDEAPKESPAVEGPTAPEPMVRGSVEVGFRVMSDIRGSNDSYRSIVNLGQGVRLVEADLTISPSLKWIDQISLQMHSWGDPYNSSYFRASKQRAYRITVDYRNIAYFNAMPSFANPNLDRGILVSERSFDMTRRYANAELEITPWTHIIPYVGFENSSGSGRGVSLYVPSLLNEYPVPTDLSDSQRTFREGVKLEYSRFHVTVEAGQSHIKDDQRLYEDAPNGNTGNRTTPLNGQTMLLRTLQQSYGIRGDLQYYRGSITANPLGWLDLFGNYLYAMPNITTNYFESATGLFASSAALPLYMRQQQLWSALANQPHNRAYFGFEMRPLSRVRVVESVYTDRLHTASSGQGATTTQTTVASTAADRLVANYNQQQIEALFDVTSKLTLRGGHRYTWGDSEFRAPSLAAFTGPESGELSRQTGLGGISYRAIGKIWLSADVEIARSDKVYFRTSLQDYERYKARVRWQVTTNFSASWNFSYMANKTPNANTLPAGLGPYSFRSIDDSISFVWTPKGGDHFRFNGEYARQNWLSKAQYLGLPFANTELSRYREDAHAGSLLADFIPATGKNHAPRFSAGGAFYRSSGSRPTLFLQPVVRTAFPIAKRLEFIGEWRYWGFGETLYPFEGFRNNQGTLSLRFWQ